MTRSFAEASVTFIGSGLEGFCSGVGASFSGTSGASSSSYETDSGDKSASSEVSFFLNKCLIWSHRAVKKGNRLGVRSKKTLKEHTITNKVMIVAKTLSNAPTRGIETSLPTIPPYAGLRSARSARRKARPIDPLMISRVVTSNRLLRMIKNPAVPRASGTMTLPAPKRP